MDLSRPLFVISVLVGSSAHLKGLRVGDEVRKTMAVTINQVYTFIKLMAIFIHPQTI